MALPAARPPRERAAPPPGPASGPRADHPWRRLARRTGKGTLWALGVLLVLFLAVWYATPFFLRDYINRQGTTLPDYRFHIDWIEVHPLTTSVDLLGARLDKKSNKIPVPFFRCPRVRFAVQWVEIVHRTFRSTIGLTQPVVNFVQGPTEAETQTILEPAWVAAVKKVVPLRINQFTIWDGVLHYYDFHASPQIDLEMDHLHLQADNLTNSTHSASAMPTTVTLTGHPFRVGEMEVHLACNVDEKQPTFEQKLRLEKVPATALNAFMAKYASVYAKSGEIAFYTEMKSEHGRFQGYLKPFFRHLVFEPMPQDRDSLAEVWSWLVNGVKDLFEDNRDVVATDIPIAGSYGNPDVGVLEAIFGAIRNAYFTSLAHGFNQPELVPNPDHREEKKK